MLFHWLVARGYSVMVERQIAHDLGLKDAVTGSWRISASAPIWRW